jgi:hypothetical protein
LVHERAPLIKHLAMFLDTVDKQYCSDIMDNLSRYQVDDLQKYPNPIEQLIYVSPMTEDNINILPSNYRKYIRSDNLDPFLKTYFVNVNEIVDRLYKEKVSCEIDCHSIAFLNKCFLKSITKPTSTDDKLYLKAIRKVKPTDVSIKRSQMYVTPY